MRLSYRTDLKSAIRMRLGHYSEDWMPRKIRKQEKEKRRSVLPSCDGDRSTFDLEQDDLGSQACKDWENRCPDWIDESFARLSP